ncbi:MAG: helix-turn-helix domain-containing protein [Treponema sp.]|nr:helix-turn-helix domain-containing protein [Treponema sp.]
MLGFLRNYSAYLDLDVQNVLSLYRALRIQEQPIPVEQLLKKPSRLPGFIIPFLIIIIILGAIGFGVYMFITHRQNNQTQTIPDESNSPVEYTMEGGSLAPRRMYKGDSVSIMIDGNPYKVEIRNIGETVTIYVPGEGEKNLDLNPEGITVDLNEDGIPELQIIVADFMKNNPDMGALIHFNMIETIVQPPPFVDQQNIATLPSATNTAISTTVIPSTQNPYPFTLQISFQGYCMFRWEILGERDRRGTNQRYFQRGQQLDIQAQNLGIRVWASNAQAARFQVIGGGRTYPLEIGTAGEVVVAEILWVRDDDGRNRLVVRRLETGP